MSAIGLRLAGAALLAALTGCGANLFGRPIFGLGTGADPIPADSLDVTLVLIGDAGQPHLPTEPVLVALEREIARDPERTFVVFLGDNLYPVGLMDTTTAAGKTGLVILRAQMDPLLRTGTRGIFVPGNHDWAAGGATGWADVVRQERFINQEGRGIVRMEPRGGCPGPVVADVGTVLRVIAIDSHWWLHAGPKPGADACPAGTQRAVQDSLALAIGTAWGRRTVVVAHHPVVSGGQHGGYFDWPAYLFPFHPWARLAGAFAQQDVTGREYRNMTAHLRAAFSITPPDVYAAGHEHNLQVFRREPARYLVVSGAGIYGHTTRTRAITGVRYIRQASGYQRLQLLADGRARLSVMVVDAEGNAHEDYAEWLDLPPLYPEPEETP